MRLGSLPLITCANGDLILPTRLQVSVDLRHILNFRLDRDRDRDVDAVDSLSSRVSGLSGPDNIHPGRKDEDVGVVNRRLHFGERS